MPDTTFPAACIVAATELPLIPSCHCCLSWVYLVSGPNTSMDYMKWHMCRKYLTMKILRVNPGREDSQSSSDTLKIVCTFQYTTISTKTEGSYRKLVCTFINYKLLCKFFWFRKVFPKAIEFFNGSVLQFPWALESCQCWCLSAQYELTGSAHCTEKRKTG